jgi:PKHD-type hydroxylase
MILNYNYWYFKSAIPPHICDQIIEHGLTKMYDVVEKFGEKSIEATTGDFRHRGTTTGEFVEANIPHNGLTAAALKKKGVSAEQSYIRDSHVSWLNDDWLYQMIWPFVHEANKSGKWNFDWDATEQLQFTKYAPNQFYGWHADSSPEPYKSFDPATDELLKDHEGKLIYDIDGVPIPKDSSRTSHAHLVGKIRKLSVTVSLSDPADYRGGNLRFDLGPHLKEKRYHLCKEIRPQGSIIVFPSHLYHCVTPVTTGTRYSLVAWNVGAPFK